MRGGGLTSIVRKFSPNQYVYVRRLKEVKGGLTPVTKPSILRIKQVMGNGCLLLQGKCTSLLKVHVEQCAPCHLPNIDPRLDPDLYRPDRHSPCEVCKLTHAFAEMLLCDRCNSGWHTFCMNPPVSKDYYFICPHCQAGGISPLSASFVPNLVPLSNDVGSHPIQEQISPSALSPEPKVKRTAPAVLPKYGPTASTRSSTRITPQEADHRRCASYHNRVVARTGDGAHGSDVMWGKVTYLGKASLPAALSVKFIDDTVKRMTADQVSPILCEVGMEVPITQVAFPTIAVAGLGSKSQINFLVFD